MLLGWDESGCLTWSVDAAFAVHNDMKLHTGTTVTMGKGGVASWSMKQKITTRSSTEAELVGVDDASCFIVWTKRFFEHQFKKYPKDGTRSRLIGRTNIVEQDNTSAIQLERCGKKSSTKRTRHINIKYFYCTELLEKKMITAITYKPTKELVADYFTKPLQGSLFRKHRNNIMGITEADEAYHAQWYKEHCGN